jgi:hypothetical protein
MIVHLSIGVWWNPSCTKNTLTKPLCLHLWKKDNDSMLRLVVLATVEVEWLESAHDKALSIDGGSMWFSKMIEILA